MSGIPFSYSSIGSSGYSGYSGTSGYSGYSGYSGIGTSGYSGYSGVSGSAAASGYSGYSGFSGNAATTVIVTYSNSFSAGQAIYRTSGGYALAQANAASATDIIGVVTAATGSQFTYVANGYTTGFTGLVDGAQYYLSDTTPGLVTTTVPTANGSIIKPVMIAIGTTAAQIVEYPGAQIGTGAIGGNGTSGYLAKFTAPSTEANSIIQDNGSTVTVNSTLSSSSTSTGALVVGNGTSGGLGVGGNINAGGTINQWSGFSSSMSSYANFNANNNSSASSFIGGVLVYSSSGYYYGMDLGYNSSTSRSRTRLFANNTSDVAFSFCGINPSSQSALTDAVTIRGDSGNVGIGTTSPTNLLSVGNGSGTNATSPIAAKVDQNSSTTLTVSNQNSGLSALAALDIEAYGGGWQIQTPSSSTFTNPLIFNFNGSSEKMRLTSAGNVGIGTTSPTTSLQINNNGTYATSGNMNTGTIVGNGSGGVALNSGAYDTNTIATSYAWFNSGYANNAGIGVPMVFATGGAERMRITSAGNVGIGITSPSYALDVTGAIRATLKGTTNQNLTPATTTISASQIDWSQGNSFYKALSANTTFTFANAVDGQVITVTLLNSASNWTVTWPTMKWTGNTAPVMTTGAKYDVYTIYYNATVGAYFGSYVQNYT